MIDVLTYCIVVYLYKVVINIKIACLQMTVYMAVCKCVA